MSATTFREREHPIDKAVNQVFSKMRGFVGPRSLGSLVGHSPDTSTEKTTADGYTFSQEPVRDNTQISDRTTQATASETEVKAIISGHLANVTGSISENETISPESVAGRRTGELEVYSDDDFGCNEAGVGADFNDDVHDQSTSRVTPATAAVPRSMTTKPQSTRVPLECTVTYDSSSYKLFARTSTRLKTSMTASRPTFAKVVPFSKRNKFPGTPSSAQKEPRHPTGRKAQGLQRTHAHDNKKMVRRRCVDTNAPQTCYNPQVWQEELLITAKYPRCNVTCARKVDSISDKSQSAPVTIKAPDIDVNILQGGKNRCIIRLTVP